MIFFRNVTITPRCVFSNFSKVSSKEIAIQIDFPKRDQILGLFLGIFLRRGKIKRTGRDEIWTYEKRYSNFSKRYLLLKEIENKRSLQIIVKNIVFFQGRMAFEFFEKITLFLFLPSWKQNISKKHVQPINDLFKMS